MSDFEDAFNAGRDAAPVPFTRIEGLPIGMVPEGFTLTDISKYLPAPTDKRGTVTVHTPQAFVTYVDAYRDTDSLILTDVNAASVTAIVDYHKAGENGAPRHGRHRVSFACRQTKEWQTWAGSHGRAMTQVAFAAFIEDNLPDIAAPTGAKLLEMARTIEVKKDVSFASAIRLSDGQQQLTYNEVVTGGGTGERGQMVIVDTVTLGIAPFEGSEKYAVEARLRFRMNEGKLSLWFELVRPHKVLEDAFGKVLEVIAAGLPNARIIAGAVGRLAE